MNYDTAVKILKEVAPDLIADPVNPQHPRMLVVRRGKDTTPFSIHLSDVTPNQEQSEADAKAEERKMLTDALASASEHLPKLAS